MIYLDEAKDDDLELMMAWRSNPVVFQGFYSQVSPLKWEEHIEWWNKRNQDWRTFIVTYHPKGEDRPRKVGIVTIGQLDHWSPEIGYYIGEIALWGKGIAREAVQLAMGYLKSQGKEYVHTTVKKSNKRSMRLLKGLGFQLLGDARDGEIWLQRKL